MADGDDRDSGNAVLMHFRHACADAFPDTFEAAIKFVRLRRMAVDRHQQRAKTGCNELVYLLGKQPAVGDECGTHTGGVNRSDKVFDLRVQERLTALEVDITDAPTMEDGERFNKAVAVYPSPVLYHALVVRVRAEVTRRVADIGDRNVADCRNQAVRHCGNARGFAVEPNRALFG